MALRVRRWTKYGHDRLYITTASGIKVGWYDLRTQRQELQQPGMWPEFQQTITTWRLAHPGSLTTAPPPARTGTVPRPRRLPPPDDLAERRAGQTLRDHARATRPRRRSVRVLTRLIGYRTSDYSWRVGAVGERVVGRKLNRLGSRWRVLHGIDFGFGGDVDHLVIGPIGVLALNSKRHPGARVEVESWGVFVRGKQTHYVDQAGRQAERVQAALSAAAGRVVHVAPVVVVSGHRRMPGWLRHRPGAVQVLPARVLLLWLRLPGRAVLSPVDVDELYALARRPATWANA